MKIIFIAIISLISCSQLLFFKEAKVYASTENVSADLKQEESNLAKPEILENEDLNELESSDEPKKEEISSTKRTIALTSGAVIGGAGGLALGGVAIATGLLCTKLLISEGLAFTLGLSIFPFSPGLAIQAAYTGSTLGINFAKTRLGEKNLSTPKYLYKGFLSGALVGSLGALKIFFQRPRLLKVYGAGHRVRYEEYSEIAFWGALPGFMVLSGLGAGIEAIYDLNDQYSHDPD